VGANDVAVIRREKEARLPFSENTEKLIFPKIHHHFIELPLLTTARANFAD